MVENQRERSDFSFLPSKIKLVQIDAVIWVETCRSHAGRPMMDMIRVIHVDFLYPE